eukprot:6482308-Amphidinium_carterae.1
MWLRSVSRLGAGACGRVGPWARARGPGLVPWAHGLGGPGPGGSGALWIGGLGAVDRGPPMG